MGVNRLSGCREFFGVHSWQNGTRCRDGVNVLWCHSHLVCQVPSLVFIRKTFFCDLFLLFLFFELFLEMVREKRGGRGG